MKYNLGVTRVLDGTGAWKPLKGAWVRQADGTWAPIQTGWVRLSDGTWERIYPTPTGVFSANVSTLSHAYYANYPDEGSTVLVTNTGEFDLTINSVVINEETTGHITTLTGLLPSFPITLAPNQSTPITFKVTGNTVGTYSTGNVQFINHIGYLGYANATINTETVVYPDYSGIGIVGDVPTLLSYVGNDEVNYNYSGYSQNQFTVPSGVTTLRITAAGGGGGGGGRDRLLGAAGYPGHKIFCDISVTTGDVIDVYVGGGGGAGASGSGTAGGAGGASYNGFSGGSGGPAGGGGWSGSGGGGGAATVVAKNGTRILIAAGGGGGGGGGNYGYGLGQYQNPNGTSYTGGNGASRGGSDGGGPGGGGGGGYGGAAGAIASGDVGSYSGSDGYDLVPTGGTAVRATNGGALAGAGGDGYVGIVSRGVGVSAGKAITIRNTGKGGNLVISSITSQSGIIAPYNLVDSTVGFNFSNYTGNTTQFSVAPYTTLGAGTYSDVITINSNAADYPVFTIPVSVTVAQASGNAVFTRPGLQTWTVPDNVHYINLFAVAGGGAGGSGSPYDTGGTGGGGGSGSYATYQSVGVTPGEVLTINVGAGGQPGGAGQQTTVSGSFGTYVIAGGSVGGDAYQDPIYGDWQMGDGTGGDGE